MLDSKIYLTVPYAQKDTAKALGARWDAGQKKWYAPANIDVMVFAQWLPQADISASAPGGTSRSRSSASNTRKNSFSNNIRPGVMTYPKDKNFVAYDGDTPPWD